MSFVQRTLARSNEPLFYGGCSNRNKITQVSETFLHKIIFSNERKGEMAKVILKNDSDNKAEGLPSIIGEQDWSGKTALHVAVILKETGMVELLVQHGENLP